MAKLTASDGASGDFFGKSVSIDGNYTIVGAYNNDELGTWAGAAYVFERTGPAWNQVAKLTALDGASEDEFGHSVSISGDYAVAGAHKDDPNGSTSGSAYVYERTGPAWNQVAKLTASDGAAFDLFGHSVSVSGDYIVVGAHGDDDNGDDTGSAYVYERSGSTWNQVAKLTASDGAPEDEFGFSVSISGDYAVVGARWDDDNGARSGSAYIFYRNEGGTDNWAQQTKLIASDGAAKDRFGFSVSISGDYAVVGARSDNDDGTSSGSAYVYQRSGSTWNQVAKLTASDGAERDYFGYSVSISGDYIVVGAHGGDDNGIDSGLAYVFERSGSGWNEVAKLTADDGSAADYFGSVSISGDYAAVGALFDDDNGIDSGSAYVFEVPEPGTMLLLLVGSGGMILRRPRKV